MTSRITIPRQYTTPPPPPTQRMAAYPNSAANNKAFATALAYVSRLAVSTVARLTTPRAAPTPALVKQEARYLGKPVVQAGRPRATNSTASSTVPSYVPKTYIPWVQKASQNTGLPASVVAAQINNESGFDPSVTSTKGAKGIAQFEPATWKAYGKGPPSNAYNAGASLGAYSAYMNALLKQYKGNVRNALAAYNAGPANIQAGYPYADAILSASGTPASATSTGGTPSTSPGTSAYGGTRPGGEPAKGSQQDTGQGVQGLFADYENELTMPRVAPADVGLSGPGAPFQWWLSSFTNQWNKEQGG